MGVGVGSAYYHLAPDNRRLVWDRLPIAVGFASFFAATITERISVRAGSRLLLPSIAAAAGSVVYWRWSQVGGAENLLPYVVVQACAIAAAALVAGLVRSRDARAPDLFGAAGLYTAMGLYAAARVAELLDHEIYAMGHVASGHTVRHLLAATAVSWIFRMVQTREPPASVLR